MKKTLIKILSYPINKTISHYKENPEFHQKKIFENLLKQGRKTLFGKEHNFKDIQTYEDFTKNVPIHSYDMLLKYIEKITKGESDILWPGKPPYLVTTSGTTSGEKYIPMTKDLLKPFMSSTRNCTANYLKDTGNFDILSKKMVILTSSPTLDKSGLIPTGKITGIYNSHMPKFMTKQKIPTLETNSLEDWEEKLEATVRESIGKDVGTVGGFPAWTIRYFERLLEVTKKKTVAEVFPNFSLLIHGGVSYTPYQKRLEALIGKPFQRLEVFSATEGFVAFKDKVDQDDLLLVPNAGVFYEFVPMDQVDSPNPERLPLWKVKKGISYAIVMSTYAGLWAYEIGDTVEFTSLAPYRIKVSGRIKHFISLSGEHLISKQVEDALATTIKKHSVQVRDFTVAPLIQNKEQGSLHEWLIEFEKSPSDMNTFSNDLCFALRNINDNYRILRESGILNNPKVTCLDKEAFVNYMISIDKMTHQNKVPRLMNNRTIADGVQEWSL